jgi:hypothetical protein
MRTTSITDEGFIKAVPQLLWLRKGREEWFSLAENHERRRGSPGFPARGAHRGQSCAALFTESRMQFDGTTKLHRKSGFGQHQLRNRYRGTPCTPQLRYEAIDKFASKVVVDIDVRLSAKPCTAQAARQTGWRKMRRWTAEPS